MVKPRNTRTQKSKDGGHGGIKRAQLFYTNSSDWLHIICPSFVRDDDIKDDADAECLAHTSKADKLLLGAVLCCDTALLVELAEVVEVINIIACASTLLDPV